MAAGAVLEWGLARGSSQLRPHLQHRTQPPAELIAFGHLIWTQSVVRAGSLVPPGNDPREPPLALYRTYVSPCGTYLVAAAAGLTGLATWLAAACPDTATAVAMSAQSMKESFRAVVERHATDSGVLYHRSGKAKQPWDIAQLSALSP